MIRLAYFTAGVAVAIAASVFHPLPSLFTSYAGDWMVAPIGLGVCSVASILYLEHFRWRKE